MNITYILFSVVQSAGGLKGLRPVGGEVIDLYSLVLNKHNILFIGI